MCANHQTDSLNCQSLAITGRFCHLDAQQKLDGVQMIVLYQGSRVNGVSSEIYYLY